MSTGRHRASSASTTLGGDGGARGRLNNAWTLESLERAAKDVALQTAP